MEVFFFVDFLYFWYCFVVVGGGWFDGYWVVGDCLDCWFGWFGIVFGDVLDLVVLVFCGVFVDVCGGVVLLFGVGC